MDLKAFSKDDFDPKGWINDFLNGITSEEKEKDSVQSVSAAVLKLQATFHETDAEIRTIADELPLILPRTLQDLELLAKDLVLLKDQMNTVGHDVRTAEKQSTEAMQTLFTLETMKQRMLLTEKALKETDNWMTLTSDIDELCTAGDSEKLSDRLVKLHKCFALLAPGLSSEAVAERRSLLSSLADRYEAIVSPALFKAFKELDRDTVTKYVDVFIIIGRTEQLQSYYWRTRVTKYCDHWESLLERHSAAKFCYALSEFYVDLTRSWQQEVQWCSLLFDQPAVLSCRVLVELSKKLESTFSSMLASKISPESEEAIALLLEFKDACDNFTESVVTSGYLPSHSDLPKQLFKLVYKPLTDSFEKFQPLFEKAFRRTLDAIIFDHVDIGECVQLLMRSEERIFEQGHFIKENCDRLLDGFIAPVYVPAYETFMVEYFSEIKRVASNLRERVSKISSGESLPPDHWSIVNHSIQIAVIAGSCWQEVHGQAAEFCSEIMSSSSLVTGRENRQDVPAPSVFIEYLMQECPRFRQLYRTFVTAAGGEDKVKAVLSRGQTALSTMATVVCTFTLDVLTKPAFVHLKSLVTASDDSQSAIHSSVSSDLLPDYSFAPRHQIAELGQYLLTLPHHLDTFGSGNERKLADALRLCTHSAVVFDKPQTRLSSSDEQQSQQTSELLLEPVSRMLTDEIISLLQRSNYRCATPSAAKQLATDIDYLLGVFDDLGQMPPSAVKLRQLSTFLRNPGNESVEGAGPDVLKLAKQLTATQP